MISANDCMTARPGAVWILGLCVLLAGAPVAAQDSGAGAP